MAAYRRAPAVVRLFRTSFCVAAADRERSVGAPPLKLGGCRANAENCAENHVAQGLLVQLEQLGDFFDCEEFVQLRPLLANRVQSDRDPTSVAA